MSMETDTYWILETEPPPTAGPVEDYEGVEDTLWTTSPTGKAPLRAPSPGSLSLALTP